MIENQKNWAGNTTYHATRLHIPETLEEVQDLVVKSKKLRVLGSRHSFNDIADSSEDLLSLQHWDQGITLDRARGTVTVGAGVKYGQFAQQLNDEGYALHNLASLPHISVAGACATATHGSGDRNGNLASVVSAMELVTANGEVLVLSRAQDGERFLGAVVGLGGVGVVTKLTLDVVPTFEVRQDLYENLPLSELEEHFEAILSSAYSVSLFTDWQGAMVNQVWLKSRIPEDTAFEHKPEFFGATPATRRLHPIGALSAENCTEQMGIAGPWHARLPHFRMDFTPSSGEELQTEYFVPRPHAFAALRAIDQIREHIAPLLMISEIRTIAADNLWMSPCYQQPCVALHFSWKMNWPGVRAVLPMIEEQLAPFNARPHWGKLFTMSPARVQALYEKLPEFQLLLQHYDPEGKFRNAFLDKYIFA